MALAGEPQGTLLAVRVWEVGESERRVVMIRIGVETSPHAKAGRLPTGLSSQDDWLTRLKPKFLPLRGNMPLGGHVVSAFWGEDLKIGEQHGSIYP